MKAAIINEYGSTEVFQITDELSKPTINDQEVLVHVHASALNPIDWRIRSGELKWIIPKRFPRILGADVSGVVEEVGNNVSDFSVGDEVYGMLDIYRGGGYSEYAPIKAMTLSHKPKGLSFEEAAAIPLAAMTALQALRDKGKLKSGQSVIINGASGGVGSFAIQIAKAYGAHVIAIASSKKEVLCRSLGADEFIDYAKQNLAEIEGQYDIFFDVASKGSYRKLRHILKSSGKYIDTVPSVKGVITCFLTKLLPFPSYLQLMAKPEKNDLEELKKLVESGKVKPVIDTVLPLEKVADGHQQLEQGHTAGKIVLKIS